MLKINDFEQVETAISSEKFKFEQKDAITEWKFDIFPKHRDADGVEYISVFLIATNMTPALKYRAKWSCSILNKYGLVQNKNSIESVYSKPGGFGFRKFIDRDNLLNEINGLIQENSIFLKFEVSLVYFFLTIKITWIFFLQLKVMEEKKFMIPERRFTYSPQMERFFLYKVFTDVTLLTNNKEIKAHKLVLAGTYNKSLFSAHSYIVSYILLPEQSATFNEIFQNDSKNIFVIKEFEYEIMLDLIKFLYTDRVESLKKNAKKLLHVAERYAVDRLRRLSERSLYENLTIENSIDTLIVSDKHALVELKEESLSFMKM